MILCDYCYRAIRYVEEGVASPDAYHIFCSNECLRRYQVEEMTNENDKNK